MTFPYDGTGGLFTRIGAMGAFLADVNTYQGTTIPTDSQAIIDQFTTNNDLVMIDGIESQASGAQNSASSITGSLQTYATNVVNTMVYQNTPLVSNTNIQASLTQLIRQMVADGQTVKACTIGSTVAAGGSNQGNGVCVASTKNTAGLVQENAFAETITLRCSQDSTSSANLAGREQFTVNGTVPTAQPLSQGFPGGSGAQAFCSAINGASDNSGNLLTNSDFETWTVANTPNNWPILVGTAGTTIKQSTAVHYTGTSSLNFVGNGSELTSVAQTFGSSLGTLGSPTSQAQYAFNLWLKVDSVPGAGVLEVSLVDGSNAITTDVAGTNNSFTFNLTGATTSFVNHSGVFRTPYILPSTLKLRIRLSTALSNGINLYIDRAALGLMTACYTGGPSVALFSGSSNFYVPDSFTDVITNNRGGASNNKTFQTLFARFFSMASYGLLLPSSGSPTISDTLI